ncbi:DUF3311 domain-containing protein [Haladaptatus caseinilyticus]|uniref:DUF3311 domain-containing protein n=1 Tax=Haladaptatus caseinilyticus TaxID=2993314 RepID=UPI00224A8865|nr:DUF3311 domain-containing protein [Haladaptatus caseinilyticus]
MNNDSARIGWMVVFAVIIALTIPWFLWGDGQVLYGLPVWLWWHIGWMAVVSLVFKLFADRAWGLGIEESI